MINKLLELQKALEPFSGKYEEDSGYREATADFYTNYAIDSTLWMAKHYPEKNLAEYCESMIGECYASSKQTMYYSEYADGFTTVYEYLIKWK